MKKISIFLVMILSLTMFLGLTACSNDDLSSELETAYQKIDELNEKIDGLTQNLEDLSNAIVGSRDSEFTVNFITSGSPVADIQSSVIQYAPTTTKENHNFVGWFYDHETTRPVSFPLSVNSNMTLYAHFKETRESLADRFNDYVKSLPEQKLEINYPIFNVEYITTIGDMICLTAQWENSTGNEECLVQEIISISLSFEYGKLNESSGSLQYHLTQSGTATDYCYYYELRDIILVNKIGSFYSLESRTLSTMYNGWNNLNISLIEDKIKTYFDYAIGDLYHELFLSGFEDTILFY